MYERSKMLTKMSRYYIAFNTLGPPTLFPIQHQSLRPSKPSKMILTRASFTLPAIKRAHALGSWDHYSEQLPLMKIREDNDASMWSNTFNLCRYPATREAILVLCMWVHFEEATVDSY
jgi:hypothetical protein